MESRSLYTLWTGFFPQAEFSGGSSRSLSLSIQIVPFLPFLLLNTILCYQEITFCLAIHPLKHIWLFLVWGHCKQSCYELSCAGFSVNIYVFISLVEKKKKPRILQLLGCIVVVYLVCQETGKPFSKQAVPLLPTSKPCERSSFSASLSAHFCSVTALICRLLAPPLPSLGSMRQEETPGPSHPQGSFIS